MTKKHLLLLVALLLLGQFQLSAQKLTFEDVTEIRLQDMAPIYQGDVVRGYFAFYYLDKAKEKYMANFKLVLLDENLNKLAEKKLVENQRTDLKFGVFNGNSIMFVISNPGKVTLEFRRYDLQLNQISTEIQKIGEIEEYFLSYANKQRVPPQVFTLDSLGYVFYNTTGLGGVRYKMRYLPDNPQKKGWLRERDDKDRDGHLPAPLAHNGKVLLNYFTENSTPSKYLQAINLETGRVVFDKETLIDQNYTAQVFYGYADAEGHFVITGQYYEKGANIEKGNSLGLFTGKMDENGKILTYKLLSWENDVSKVAKCNKDGKFEGKGFIFFRDVVHTKDGKLYLAGETFDRVVIGLNQGVEVRDFAIVEIDPDMSLKDIQFFKKPEHFYSTGGLLTVRNPDVLANYVRLSGGFDYQYVQTSEDKDAFTFYYSFLEEYGDKWKKYHKWLGTISKHAADAAYETDKISLKTEATSIQVLPAKPGHLLIVEYFSKAKKLDMRIEKFNY